MTPEKMPAGKNIAVAIEPAIQNFSSINIKNNHVRPTSYGYSNAWLGEIKDETPELKISWAKKQKISMLRLFFDCDFDNALPSVFVKHPTSEIHFTVKEYRIYDDHDNLLFETLDNYQAVNKVVFDKPINTKELNNVLVKKDINIPISIFKISAYS